MRSPGIASWRGGGATAHNRFARQPTARVPRRCLESGGETARGAHRAISVRMSAGRRAWAMVGRGSSKRDHNVSHSAGVGDIVAEGAGGRLRTERNAQQLCAASRLPRHLRPWCRDRREHDRLRALQDAVFVPGCGTCTHALGVNTLHIDQVFDSLNRRHPEYPLSSAPGVPPPSQCVPGEGGWRAPARATPQHLLEARAPHAAAHHAAHAPQ